MTPARRWPSPALGRSMLLLLLHVVFRIRCLEYLRSDPLLDAEERWFQDDVVCRYAPDVEEVRELDAELLRHEVVGGLVAGRVV